MKNYSLPSFMPTDLLSLSLPHPCENVTTHTRRYLSLLVLGIAKAQDQAVELKRPFTVWRNCNLTTISLYICIL